MTTYTRLDVTFGRSAGNRVGDATLRGPAQVWVEFHDIVVYPGGDDCMVFAGRERGEFRKGTVVLSLEIRTTRILHRVGGRWGQVHHHGSITDPERLANYQHAVRA